MSMLQFAATSQCALYRASTAGVRDEKPNQRFVFWFGLFGPSEVLEKRIQEGQPLVLI